MIDNMEARSRFSERLAEAGVSVPSIGPAIYLARIEARSVEGNTPGIPCSYCPYLSRSFHEASMHARIHPK